MTSEAADPRVVATWVWALDPDVASLWGDALVGAGVRVAGAGADVPDGSFTLVLLLDPGLIDADTALLVARLALDHPERVIPVSLGSRPAEVLPELSHVVVGDRTPLQVSADLADSISLGGANVVAFSALRDRARVWQASGRPDSSLLDPARSAEALTLLGVPGLGEAAGSDDIRALAAASTRRHRGRRRGLAFVAAAAAFSLLLGSVAAMWQQGEARAAAEEARQHAQLSTSVRLAAQAELAVAGDPDRAWLLAEAAITAAPTAQARAAGFTVLNRIPRHITLDLGGVARGVTASANGRTLAVGLVDGTVKVLDDQGTEILTVPSASTEVAYNLYPRLAPDGQRLLLPGPEPRLLALPSGTVLPVTGGSLPANAPAVWLTNDTALMVEGDTLTLLRRNGVVETASLQRALRGVRWLEANPSGSAVFIMTVRESLVWDVETRSLTPIAASGFQYGTFTDDRTLLLAREAGFPWEVDIRNPAAKPTEVFGPYASRVWVHPDGYQLLASGPNVRVRLSTGQIIHDFPTARGNVTGAAFLNARRIATVAGDGNLRIWELPWAKDPIGQRVSTVTIPVPRDAIESNRAQLIRTPEGFGLTFPTDKGVAAVLDNDLNLVARSRVPFLSTLRPGPKPNTFAMFTENAIETFAAGESSSRRRATLQLQPPDTALSIPTALDSHGVAVAYADAADLVHTFLPEGETRAFRLSARAIRLFFMADGSTCGVTITGRLECEDGTQAQLLEEPLAAAEPTFDGGLLAVSRGGTLVSWQGETRELGSSGISGAIALRASPDGRVVAVIGDAQTDLIDTADMKLVGRWLTGNGQSAVQDVAFVDHENYVVVHGMGALARGEVFDADALATALRSGAPRNLTDEELASYEVDPELVEG